MRKILGIAVLMLAFCCPTLAGEIHIPPAPAGEIHTPPAPTDGIIQTGAPAPTAEDGIIHGDNADTLTQIALELLASVLP